MKNNVRLQNHFNYSKANAVARAQYSTQSTTKKYIAEQVKLAMGGRSTISKKLTPFPMKNNITFTTDSGKLRFFVLILPYGEDPFHKKYQQPINHFKKKGIPTFFYTKSGGVQEVIQTIKNYFSKYPETGHSL